VVQGGAAVRRPKTICDCGNALPQKGRVWFAKSTRCPICERCARIEADIYSVDGKGSRRGFDFCGFPDPAIEDPVLAKHALAEAWRTAPARAALIKARSFVFGN
jgi:hypothetical protein